MGVKMIKHWKFEKGALTYDQYSNDMKQGLLTRKAYSFTKETNTGKVKKVIKFKKPSLHKLMAAAWPVNRENPTVYRQSMKWVMSIKKKVKKAKTVVDKILNRILGENPKPKIHLTLDKILTGE